MKNLNPDVIQNWIDFLILNTLAHESMHGSDIEQRVEEKIRRYLNHEVSRDSILKALQRLESAGWLGTELRQTEDLKLEKVYSITCVGKEQLEAEWKHRKWTLTQFLEEGKWPAFRSQKAAPDSWN